MINVGIEEAGTPLAGEIIRILVNHPDVELKALSAPALAGKSVAAHHYGLIGECNALFTPELDPASLDALIICGPELGPGALSTLKENFPDLIIVDATHTPSAGRDGFIFGLSEIYRKPLVRGARCSYVPYPEQVAALIALYPLAARLLLGGDIDITLEADPAITPQSRLNDSAASIERHLREAQLSFNGKIRFTLAPKPGARALRISFTLPLAIDTEAAHEAFEDIYDDHNFTFHPETVADEREVAGTHKCIIGISAPEAGSITVTAIIDPLMRGGASEAVHLLNLLFGLHERTGLTLKASAPYTIER